MQLFPISDLHLESDWKKLSEYRGNADVIIAAGDIYTKTNGPVELRRIFGEREIIYVAGNHEYYGAILLEEDNRLRNACQDQGIHYLQCDSVEINGVTFCGCTFWSDFKLFGESKKEEARSEVGRYLNDYHLIRVDKESHLRLSTLQTLAIHQQHKDWLTEQFEINRGTPLVVVTHHGPSTQCVHPSYTQELLCAGFASNLDDLIKQSGAKYWICGHSHIAHHFTIAETEVWMNCKGYAKERIEGFDPWLELEI